MLIILDDFPVKWDLIFSPSKDETEIGGEIKVAHLKVKSSTNMHAINFMFFISETETDFIFWNNTKWQCFKFLRN